MPGEISITSDMQMTPTLMAESEEELKSLLMKVKSESEVPCLFNLYAEYIMRNAGLEETQAGIKIAGRNTITSDMQVIPPLWQKGKKN